MAHNMKRKLLVSPILAIFLSLSLFLPTVQAVTIDSRPIYDRIVAPSSDDVLTPDFATNSPSLSAFINFLFDMFVRRLLPWLAALMVLLIIWAGYTYILAGGDSAKIKQAKDMILYSLIAMVVAIAGLSIITILNNILMAAR